MNAKRGLKIAAFVLFAVAALGMQLGPIGFVPAGLACFVLAEII